VIHGFGAWLGRAQPLHDDHDRGSVVVDAVRHRLAEEPHRLLALQGALGLNHVVGVVEDDAVAALAGSDASDRGGELEAGHVVVDAPLAGLPKVTDKIEKTTAARLLLAQLGKVTGERIPPSLR